MVMLDEPESGVDVENLSVIGQIANTLLTRSDQSPSSIRKGGLVVTHTGFILDFIQADLAYVMVDGRISCSGEPRRILETIAKFGYDPCQSCTGDCTICLASQTAAPRPEPRVRLSVDPAPVKLTTDMVMDADIPRLDTLHEIVIQGQEADAVLKLPQNSGEYMQRDCQFETALTVNPDIEVLSLKDALEKYDWMEKYMWKVVKKDADYVTKHVDEQEKFGNPQGYVIIAHENAKCEHPIEANLRLENADIQHVHNVLIAKPGSEMHVISGCTCSSSANGKHYGISEFFVEESATITFSMIHRWCTSVEAYPRSASHVARNGSFVSNYVCLAPVTKVQLNPLATLEENASARFNSIIYAREGTVVDAGSRAILNGRGSTAEVVSRIISSGGHVIARALCVGNAPDTRGHVECQGLLIGEDTAGKIWALPQIDGNHRLSELSHEASVGRISTEKIQYLQSRGLTEDEATSAIVSGFLVGVEIQGIPKELQDSIKAIVKTAAELGF
ncbi:hypothetical protein GEMRC1_003274 [Eukaryota sp. GEM-RC1]